MATQTRDTHTQDLIKRFALRMAGMRQDSVMRGPMRLLQFLILRLFFKDFFAGMSKLLADLAEQRRNGTLPEMAPAVEPEEARAWSELRQRKSGWAGYRKPEEACGGSAVPEIAEPIDEVPAAAPRVRVRTVTNTSAWPKHVDGGAGIPWTGGVGYLGFSKNPVLAAGQNCGHLVTI